MREVDTELMKQVVLYLRKGTARALSGRMLSGMEVPPDAAEGRHAPYWVHEARVGGARPVLFEVHGGGFALGDARKEDALRAWVRDSFDIHVVGVEYRLAPEHPAPAALQDVVATMAHIARGSVCDADASRFYLLGYSAVANLALATAFVAQARADFKVAGLALHYPFLDACTPPDSVKGRAIDLPYEMMVAFNDWYVADGDARDPLVSPVFASDAQLAALPPVALYPVVGDPLQGQAEALRERMERLGCRMSYRPVEGVYHGYIEDAADLETYRATSMPATVAARPADFARAAGVRLKASLEDVLGPAVADVPIPGIDEKGDSL